MSLVIFYKGVIVLAGGSGIIFWIVVAAILIVVEMSTVQLVCIWFAIGSLFAALACFVDAAFWLQLLIFLISSIAVLIVGRPLLVDRLTPKKQATNADRVIGQLGVALQEIDNLNQTGRVTANGLDWTARSAYGEVIPEGATVLVLQIDGVKLIVQPLPQPTPESSPCQPDYYAPPAPHPSPPPAENTQGPAASSSHWQYQHQSPTDFPGTEPNFPPESAQEPDSSYTQTPQG